MTWCREKNYEKQKMSNIKVIFQKLPASELDFQEIDQNFSFTTIKSFQVKLFKI